MEEAAIGFLLDRLEEFIIREVELPGKVNDGVESLKLELETIGAFLKETEKRGKNEQVKVWIRHVRQQAHEIEDTLDTLDYQSAEQSNASWRITKSKQNHATMDRINKINIQLEKIKTTRDRYIDINSRATSSNATSNFSNVHPQANPLYMEEADIMGVEEPRKELVRWAQKDETGLEVKFVVGMGGLGKTTLVKNVYDKLKANFAGHAWINISRVDDRKDLLLELCNSLDVSLPSTGGSQSLNMLKLVDLLRDALGLKRCLVVLDNLLTKEDFEFVKNVFPNSSHSRIIVTTRRGDIAKSLRDQHVSIYDLKPLSSLTAQQLFHKKVFPFTNQCPRELVTWAEKILNHCKGLPMGIISIGRLLSSVETSEEHWMQFHDSLGSELKSSGRLSDVMKALFQCYNDLPCRLKYCFLYLSMFPEDYDIRSRKLIRLWIAEKLVEEKRGRTLEEVGEEYLKELIERSLIQGGERDFDGKPKTCRVHNLIHKIIVSKSEEEKFCVAYIYQNQSFDEKARRVSIHNGHFNASSKKFTCARTFFMFGMGGCATIALPKFNLLKVLDLEDAPLDSFPAEIWNLLLLRYLSLRNTGVKSLPNFISNLKNLETLDLKQTYITELPKKICELHKLRHLLIYRYDMTSRLTFNTVVGFKAPDRIGNLTSLQKLSFINAGKHVKMIQELGRLAELRKLGIIGLEVQHGKDLCCSIEKMRGLRSLSVASLHQNEYLDLHSLTMPPRLLKRVYLKGRLYKFPNWISSLNDLVRIRLQWSRLSDDPIRELEDLPNLIELQLLDAYVGDRLVFGAQKFKKLKVLEFESLNYLERVIFAYDSLPCLTKFILRRCQKLSVPIGMYRLTQLEEFHLCEMPEEFQKGVRHIPQLRCYSY